MLFKDWDIVLTGQHIRITPITERDEVPYSRLFHGGFYDRFEKAFGKPPESPLKTILDHTAKDETHAIRPVGSESFIGWITLQRNDEEQPDVGISLIPEYRDKGYGPEAVMLFVNHLYVEYGLKEISVRILETNQQSRRAFAKVGAVFYKAHSDMRFEKLKRSCRGQADDMKVPVIRCYHIPLPVKEIRQSASLVSETGQEDNVERLLTAACGQEIDELIDALKHLEDPDPSEIIAVILAKKENLRREGDG